MGSWFYAQKLFGQFKLEILQLISEHTTCSLYMEWDYTSVRNVVWNFYYVGLCENAKAWKRRGRNTLYLSHISGRIVVYLVYDILGYWLLINWLKHFGSVIYAQKLLGQFRLGVLQYNYAFNIKYALTFNTKIWKK